MKNKDSLKKHHFWILFGLVPLFVLIAVFVVSSSVGGAIAALGMEIFVGMPCGVETPGRLPRIEPVPGWLPIAPPPVPGACPKREVPEPGNGGSPVSTVGPWPFAVFATTPPARTNARERHRVRERMRT